MAKVKMWTGRRWEYRELLAIPLPGFRRLLRAGKPRDRARRCRNTAWESRRQTVQGMVEAAITRGRLAHGLALQKLWWSRRRYNADQWDATVSRLEVLDAEQERLSKLCILQCSHHRRSVQILTNVAMGRLQRAEVWQAGMLQVAKLLIVIIEAEGGLGFAAAVAELGGADAASVDHRMAEEEEGATADVVEDEGRLSY